MTSKARIRREDRLLGEEKGWRRGIWLALFSSSHCFLPFLQGFHAVRPGPAIQHLQGARDSLWSHTNRGLPASLAARSERRPLGIAACVRVFSWLPRHGGRTCPVRPGTWALSPAPGEIYSHPCAEQCENQPASDEIGGSQSMHSVPLFFLSRCVENVIRRLPRR